MDLGLSNVISFMLEANCCLCTSSKLSGDTRDSLLLNTILSSAFKASLVQTLCDGNVFPDSSPFLLTQLAMLVMQEDLKPGARDWWSFWRGVIPAGSNFIYSLCCIWHLWQQSSAEMSFPDSGTAPGEAQRPSPIKDLEEGSVRFTDADPCAAAAVPSVSDCPTITAPSGLDSVDMEPSSDDSRIHELSGRTLVSAGGTDAPSLLSDTRLLVFTLFSTGSPAASRRTSAPPS